MAEFKMPKYMRKGTPFSLVDCYRELSHESYQSPVNVVYQDYKTKLEGDIFEAILSYGIDVDKDELIKALQYDRNQYEKGFIDGCRDHADAFKAEVAREIFEEIASKQITIVDHVGTMGVVVLLKDIFELKKKYTGEQT